MNAYESPFSNTLNLMADNLAPAQSAPPSPETTINRLQLQAAVQSLNQYVAPLLEKIEFVLQDQADALTVMVVHQDDRHFIRQIPPDEVLQIARAIHQLQAVAARSAD